MRIIVAEPDGYPGQAFASLKKHAEVICGPFSRDSLLTEVAKADALIIRFAHRIDEALVAQSRSLSLISCAATGSDHIDLEACRKFGVAVQTLKGETQFLRTITATAELTWWHILNLTRRAADAAAHVSDGGWNRDLYIGNQLYGKTLGLLGVGRLGTMVAGYGLAFGMTVLGCDPFATEHVPGVKYVDAETLFSESDIVSVHVNLTNHTRRMIGEQLLSRMRRGSFLVNTARGDLVDEQALMQVLEKGIIGGVGLDVLADEGTRGGDWPHSSLIWQKMQNDRRICITPHIGGATVESMSAAEIFMAEKLIGTMRADRRELAS